MAWKNTKQCSFAGYLVNEHSVLKALDEVHDLIDWERIEGMLSCIHADKKGEQAWPLLLMFKAMLLQSWYNLSDSKLEEQLARDLLFRRFVGLSVVGSVPDHRARWCFRNHPKMELLQGALLTEIEDQLAGKNFYVKMGAVSIVDASVIHAQCDRPGEDKHGNDTQFPRVDYNY